MSNISIQVEDTTLPSASLAPAVDISDITPIDPNTAPLAAPQDPAVQKTKEKIDYDAIAERVTTDPITFFSNMRQPDSVEVFLQCKEFIHIASEETDAPIDSNRVRAGTTSFATFVRLGAAREGTDHFIDGITFRQELRKCIYATAAWEAGCPGAKVEDKLAEYKIKTKKEVEAKQKKAEAAAKRKEKTAQRNERNWKKQNKPVLLKECEKRDIATKGLKVDELRKLLFADDQRIADEIAAKEKKSIEQEAASEGLNSNIESKDDDAMDVVGVTKENEVSEDDDDEDDDEFDKYF